MAVELSPLLNQEAETSEPIYTHIIQGDAEMSAAARIMEAMVNGTALTALCGYTWVPSRNPENHPMCQKCIEIFEFALDYWSDDE